MTHAELLRSHANLAIKEGGMYYSGEYLSRMADVAESLEAENAKLRELVRILVHCMDEVDNCDSCPINGNPYDVSKEWAACDTLREMLCELVAEADE